MDPSRPRHWTCVRSVQFLERIQCYILYINNNNNRMPVWVTTKPESPKPRKKLLQMGGQRTNMFFVVDVVQFAWHSDITTTVASAAERSIKFHWKQNRDWPLRLQTENILIHFLVSSFGGSVFSVCFQFEKKKKKERQQWIALAPLQNPLAHAI